MVGRILSALRKSREIELTVKGRVSGKAHPRPVWFVLSGDGGSLYLVPVRGRKTQWFLNVKKEAKVTVKAGDVSFEGNAAELPSSRLEGVLDAFRVKYGEGDIEKYYPNKEVAVEVRLPP